MTAASQVDIETIANRLRETGAQTKNELYTWWVNDLGMTFSALQEASREMIRSGVAMSSKVGGIQTLELAIGHDLVNDEAEPPTAAEDTSDNDTDEGEDAQEERPPTDQVAFATIAGETFELSRPSAKDEDGTVWIGATDAGRILGMSTTGARLRLRKNDAREKHEGTGARAPVFFALQDVVTVRNGAAGQPSKAPKPPKVTAVVAPGEMIEMEALPMPKRVVQVPSVRVVPAAVEEDQDVPVLAREGVERDNRPWLVFRCKISRGEVVEILLPQSLTSIDVDKIHSFLRTQID